MTKVIAVTGASGFVGQALCSNLLSRGALVRPLVRTISAPSPGAEMVAVGDIGAETDWSAALAGVDCVIHCAARAHVLQERAVNPLAAFRVVNVAGTRRLAEQAATMGVRRLIFLSSIGVLGVNTNGRKPFSIADRPAPQENYGISKWEGEETLWQVAAHSSLEVVVVRPPLVYGPGVQANFLRLLQLVKCGLPLPLGAVDNLRSLVSLDNLVDLLIRCVDHPAAAKHAFLVSDDHDISTPELIRNLAELMGRRARLLPGSPRLLRLGGRLLGRLAEIERLIGSLQVDVRYTRERLQWIPPMSVEEGLYRTVRSFLGSF